jgi:diguanylate cyclase (GGDEF)-like protein/PAS domain S-box-containing protein
VFEVFVDARPIEDDVDATRRDVFLISVATGAALLALLALAFGGASRRLTMQNRRLVQLNDRLNVMTGDLQQSEARFRSLVQNSSDVVVVLDMAGAILYESDAVRRVLGHPPESRLGRAFSDGLHPEDRPRLQALLASLGTLQGSQQTADFRLVHADGTWRWVEAIGLNLSNDPAVGGLVLNFRDVTERKRLEDQLQHEALHDPLTGLANRALFTDRVTHALARVSRNGHEGLAVLFVDLDDFKVVNDSLGHAAGDGLLMAMAERIRACLRRQDTPARLGGDEFGILLEETDAQTAEQVAHRILDAISQPFAISGRQIFAQASIGIDLDGRRDAPAGGSTAEELLRNADAAMYTAKARGKGRVEFFESGMHASALRRLELRSRLEAALEAGDFVLHYQPVVDLVSGEWAGVEALVRWRQEDGHLLPPDEFIPLAEESGLIVALGTWVLREATHQAARLRDAFDGARLSMAVNVSSRQLQDAGFAQIVEGALTDSGVPADLLVLELTESALLADEDAAAVVLGVLKQLGIRISLDDFGTGYSSLSHLRRFPIDVLKIDRSFVTDIDAANSGERALVHSIVRLAHSLNLETVAEGIERPEQVVRLRAIGAQYGQGYHFARPMDAAALLRTHRRRRRAAS